MNAKGAEALLPAYRAGDKPDARALKAARFAENDPALREKLREQAAFDAQVMGAVRSIEPPADLREKLGAVREARAGAVGRRQWLSSAGLAVAAGVLLIIGVLVYHEMESRADFPGKGAVEGLLAVCGKMDGTELEIKKAPVPAGQLGDALYMAGFEGFALPPEFNDIPAVGWRVFKLQGHRLAQFAVDRSNALVFVFRASDFGVQTGEGHDWRLIQREGWAGAVKAQGGMCTLVAIYGGRGEVQDFLKTLKRP